MGYALDYLASMVQVIYSGNAPEGTRIEVHSSPRISSDAVAYTRQAQNLTPQSLAAEAVTFSCWRTFNLTTGHFGICDVRRECEACEDRRQKWAFGYGFSFAYLRDIWRLHWFRDMDLGEDYDFFD